MFFKLNFFLSDSKENFLVSVTKTHGLSHWLETDPLWVQPHWYRTAEGWRAQAVSEQRHLKLFQRCHGNRLRYKIWNNIQSCRNDEGAKTQPFLCVYSEHQILTAGRAFNSRNDISSAPGSTSVLFMRNLQQDQTPQTQTYKVTDVINGFTMLNRDPLQASDSCSLCFFSVSATEDRGRNSVNNRLTCILDV